MKKVITRLICTLMILVELLSSGSDSLRTYADLRGEKGVYKISKDSNINSVQEYFYEADEGSVPSTEESEVESGRDIEANTVIEEEKRKDVIVGVIDTGAAESIPIPHNRMLHTNYNFTKDDTVFDLNGHGSQICRIIASYSDENVKIMPIKAADQMGEASAESVSLAIEAAMSEGVHIINLSMNSIAGKTTEKISESLLLAVESGITVIVSAGNEGGNTMNYSPSDLDQVIVVGALGKDGQRADFSNYGKTLDFVSDGVEPEGVQEGTSYAAAQVTAIAAMIKSEEIHLNPEELERRLVEDATDQGVEGWDLYTGHGYLGAEIAGNRVNFSAETSERTLLSLKDWESCTEDQLIRAYVNSDITEIAGFVQANSDKLELLLHRLEDLKEPLLTNDPTIVLGTKKYEYYLTLDLGEFHTSAGLDIGHLSGYFWLKMSCGNYYYSQDPAQRGDVRTDYKINLINHASGDQDRRVTMTIDNKYRQDGSLNPSDYFNLKLDRSTSKRKQGGDSAETNMKYSVYTVDLSYLTKEFHDQKFSIEHYRSGFRLNTREYDINNSAGAKDTLRSEAEIDDRRRSFTLQINATNTGQGSIHNGVKWIDDPNSVHAIAKIHQKPYSVTAKSEDYYSDTGLKAGSSGINMKRLYPDTLVQGRMWGISSPYTGYHFESDTEANYYAPKQLVNSQSVRRYFAPNQYIIKYNPGGGKGKTAATTHVYNKSSWLSRNYFNFPITAEFRLGADEVPRDPSVRNQSLYRSFLGWRRDRSTLFSENQSIINLTSVHGATIDLSAEWGSGSGRTPAQDQITKRGYILTGWKCSDGKEYQCGSAYTTNTSVVFTPVWMPGTFLINLNAPGSEQSNRPTKYVYQKYTIGYFADKELNQIFLNNRITVPIKYAEDSSLPGGKRKYQFMGYFTEKEGKGTAFIGQNGELLSKIGGYAEFTYFAADTTVHAHWRPYEAVRFLGNVNKNDLAVVNLGNVKVPDIQWKSTGKSMTLNYEEARVTDPIFEKAYRFLGWSLTPEINGEQDLVLSKKRPVYEITENGDCVLYAQWDTSFQIVFIGNGQNAGGNYLEQIDSIFDSVMFSSNDKGNTQAGGMHFEKYDERQTIDLRTGSSTDINGNEMLETIPYQLIGWSLEKDRYAQRDSMIYTKDPVHGHILFAEASNEKHLSNKMGLSIGAPSADYYSAEGGQDPLPIPEEFSTNRMPFLNFYAVWDSFPQILASDLYFSLEDARNGVLTEQYILDCIQVLDDTPNCEKAILDYQETEFTGAESDDSFSIWIQAPDQVGNISKKTIFVFLVDTEVQNFDLGDPRFISKDFLPTVDASSIWSEGAYQEYLLQVLNIKKKDILYTEPGVTELALGATPIPVPGSGVYENLAGRFEFTHEKILEMQEWIKQLGPNTANEMYYQTFLEQGRKEGKHELLQDN
ncbi:MAG: S8 family peptidase [Lachnospiraceae bacterium]